MKGNRISVDVAVLNYSTKSQFITSDAYKKDLIFQEIDYEGADRFMLTENLRIFNQIIAAGCCPVAVFDGNAPDLKQGTKKDRFQKGETRRQKIANLRRIGRALLDPIVPYAPTPEDMAFLGSFKKQITNMEELRDRLSTEVRGNIIITNDDRARLWKIFTAIGIPCVRAPSEAEQACAQMTRHRHTMATVTTDSDCLVYGCSIMISKLLYNKQSTAITPPRAEIYLFANVLAVLGLTNSQFIDFCILCGTDFNKNIPGFGPSKNHELILEFGSIPNIIAAKKTLLAETAGHKAPKLSKFQKLIMAFDDSHLNYDAVRCFFTSPVEYVKTDLTPIVTLEKFEAHRPELMAILGDKLWPAVEVYAKEMMSRLENVAKNLQP
jgi:5'-3' exonuclease